MSKRLLILLMVLILVVAGAGVWWYLNPDSFDNLFGNSTNTTNTTNTTNATNENTNAATVNAALPSELKGDREIDQTVTVAGIDVHFSSYSLYDSYEGQAAPEDRRFVVVFFDALQSSQVYAVQQGLLTGVILWYPGGLDNLRSLKVASDAVSGDRGYLKFAAPTDAVKLTVQIGLEDPKSFELPL